MYKRVCYIANILARQSKEMNGLQCLVALVASHKELEWTNCRHGGVVGVSGRSMVRRGQVVKWRSGVATEPQIRRK